MAFEGGYSTAVNAETRRDYERAAIQEMLFALQQAQQQAKAQEQAKSIPARANAFLPIGPPEGQPPVQPPMPGQASVPMMPPPQGPSPFGPQGGMPSPMMAPKPPLPMLAGGAPQGAPPPMAGGMGAAAPAPPAGGPPAAPDSWKPMPEGTPGPPAAPQPPAMSAKMWDLGESLKKMKEANVSPEDQAAYIPYLEHTIAQHNKTVADEARINLEAQQASAAAAKAVYDRAHAAKLDRDEKGPLKPTSTMQNVEAMGLKPGTPEYQAAMRRATFERKAGAAGTGGGGGVGYGQEFEKLKPRQQEAVRFYATQQIGGDPTWRTGLSRTRGGSDLIKAVDEYVPVLAQELGLSAADVGTNKAKSVASRSALTQITKDLSSIKPFASMLDQNAEILKGLATKIIKTQSPLANRPINYLQSHVAGDPDVAEFLAQMRLVQTEAARVITNPRLVGQLTDTAREELEGIINGTMSLNATNRVLDRLINDSQRRVGQMEVQQKTLEGNIKGMMGGGVDPSAKPPTSDVGRREFKNEEDARKANLPDGTPVRIGGVRGKWKAD